MYKSKANVKYLGIDPNASEQLERPAIKWYTMKVEKNYTKKYHCALASLMILSGSARAVLDVAVEVMDKDNLVTNSASFKDDVNRLVSIHGKPFSDNTINKAFAELSREDFLIKGKKRGLYKVNPVYYFKGTEEERIKAIREVAEMPIEQSAKAVRIKFADRYKPP